MNEKTERDLIAELAEQTRAAAAELEAMLETDEPALADIKAIAEEQAAFYERFLKEVKR